MSKFIKVIQVLVSSLMLFVSNNKLTLKRDYDADAFSYNQLTITKDENLTVTIKCIEIMELQEAGKMHNGLDSIYDPIPIIVDFNKFFDKQNNEKLKIMFKTDNEYKYKVSNDQAEKEKFLETIMEYHRDNKNKVDYDPPIDKNVCQARCIQENIGNCSKRYDTQEIKKNKNPCPFKIEIEKIPGIMKITGEAIWEKQIDIEPKKTIGQFINSRIILV